MIQSLESLHRAAQERGSRVLAVTAAQDAEVLLAVDAARKLGIATAILVGDEEQIRAIAQAHDIPLEPHRILPEPDKVQACRTAVKLVRDGQADAVMKGIVDTSIILKAVLDKEIGLRDAPVLSHVALFQVPGYDRLLYVTDAAMNIAPDLEAKKHIVSNAVKVAHALGNPNPIVACLCAVEKVEPKFMASILYSSIYVLLHHRLVAATARARAMELSLVCSLSAREVTITGALAPTMRPAFWDLAMKTIDL